MLLKFLKSSLRSLWKNKTYSFLNIFGLAIGIACAGIIYLWVEDELSYDSVFANNDRLCQIQTNQTYNGLTRTFYSTPGLLAPSISKELPGIETATRVAWNKPLFSLADKAIYEQGFYGDSSFLTMFSLTFEQGNPKVALRELKSVLVSEKMAKQFFGSSLNAIGKNLKVDNKEDYRVTGVFKDMPSNSTLQFDWISPFEIFSKDRPWLKRWSANSPRTYALLSPEANFDSVNKRLSGFIHFKDAHVTTVPILLAMKDWRLRSNFVDGKQSGGRIQFVRLFAIIAWIILIIACINFMNLATARSEKRAREVGVLKVLGARKGALVVRFIGEAMLMSVLSVATGVLLIRLLLPFFNMLVEKQLGLGLAQPLHLTALVVVAIFCGLVAGSYPSLYLSSFNPVFVFKGLSARSGGAAMIRKSLVVFQFAISITLIICTALIYQQVQHIKSRELGYNKNNLMDMELTGSMQTDFARIKQDLLSTGVVQNAALCNDESLYTSDNTSGYSWDGKDPHAEYIVSYRAISPEYLSTMGMHLVEGRDFYPNVNADSSSVVITETMAKMMAKGSALGKILREGDRAYNVVGIVQDYVYGDMYGKPDPVAFFAQPDQTSFLYVRFKENLATDEVLAKVGAVIKKDNPSYPFDYKFVDEEFDSLFKSEALVGSLSGIFASLAIVISCLGLFGLSAYTAERRTKEIGIRRVLGASATGIAGLLSRDFLKLVVISTLIAFPLAWWSMDRWLATYAYRISINGWVFALAGLAAVLIALLTISFQSIRAAVANPVRSLRTE
jgi:putative ABC transport system permease protein